MRRPSSLLRRVVVVYKQTQLARLRRAQAPLRRWQLRPVVARLRASDAAHRRALAAVTRTLRRQGIPFNVAERATLPRAIRASLVITVGGDGTFLRAAHHLTTTPILGVNSDPGESQGVFCATDARRFARTLAWLRAGRLPLVRLPRLGVCINGRRLPELVLNDVLITHRNPGASSRYLLRVGRRQEEQVSSGIWLATGAGSTGAARSAGGRVLGLSAQGMSFVVREPYPRRGHRYRLAQGVVSATGCASLTYLVSGGAVYLDGPHVRYALAFGDEVCVWLADQPLLAFDVRR